MRIALVFPNFWPYVRRGAERLINEYAQILAADGHDVDIVTSKPGPGRIVRRDRLSIYYYPQRQHPVLAHYWFWFRFYSFALDAFRHLVERPYDIGHIWFYMYGPAMRAIRRLRGLPYVYQSMSETLHWGSWLDRTLFQWIARGADVAAALTPRLARDMARDLGRSVEVVRGSVDMQTFVPRPGRDLSAPRVLFASDLFDPSKGAALLLRAWPTIHRRFPKATLSLAGPTGQTGMRGNDEAMRRVRELVDDPTARAAIEFAGTGRLDDLPRRYAEAAVTVLPSISEALGLVLIESLACGTPVVGSTCYGPGEIISDTRIGQTVPLRTPEDLEDAGRAGYLAEAVCRAIELASDPETTRRCREHAGQWSREAAGEDLRRVYRAAGAGRHLNRVWT